MQWNASKLKKFYIVWKAPAMTRLFLLMTLTIFLNTHPPKQSTAAREISCRRCSESLWKHKKEEDQLIHNGISMQNMNRKSPIHNRVEKSDKGQNEYRSRIYIITHNIHLKVHPSEFGEFLIRAFYHVKNCLIFDTQFGTNLTQFEKKIFTK